MRLSVFCVIAMCIALPIAAGAVTRDDLSEDAKKFVPETAATIVRMKNGQEHEGTLVADTLEAVSLRISSNGAITVSSFPKEQVASVSSKDIMPGFARRLLERFTLEGTKPDKAEYKLAISLFDEFLSHGKDSADGAAISARRKAFKQEMDKLEENANKIDARVLSQASDAMNQYDADTTAIKAMLQQFPGIDQPAYAGDAEARAKYKSAFERRQIVLTKMPEVIKGSVTGHLSKKAFAKAAQELDLFVKMWVNIVIPEEARRRGADPKTVAKEMNFGFIVELQKNFMRKYLDAGNGQGELPSSYRMPKDMVLIPGGYFLMGRDGAVFGDFDFPLRIVYVEPFLIDRFEVRNKDYNEFASRVKRTADYSNEHPTAPALKDHTSQGSRNPLLAGDDLPVTGVDWLDAYAYAKAKGKRLPTEAEWEKAARGMKLRKYPWGTDEPVKVVVNSADGRAFLAAEMNRQNPPAQQEKSLLEKVGLKDAPPPPPASLPRATWPAMELLPSEAIAAQKAGKFQSGGVAAVSPYKLFHMGGNAAEWVSDWYDPVYYTLSPMHNPKGPESGTIHVYRGGSYLSPASELLTTWRGTSAGGPTATGCSAGGEPMIGFRCVKDLGEVRP
ncbi:MAG: SUMF1/EgtB/PvdO family nonheme iron enzyme [bacterium]